MKKKINIILFVVVCGIWTTIAYRYFVVKEVKTDYFVASHNDIPIQRGGKDTFNLIPLQRDPFLGNVYRVKVQKSIEQPVTVPHVNRKPKNQNIAWPQIEYMGFIKAHDKEKELVILKINGKIHRTRKAETIQEVYIKDIFKDSVIVKFNKEQMTFIKNGSRR
jgi:hypothetical protein